MADDQTMWGNNRVVAPTPAFAIVTVELGDNFNVKGHHLSMIINRQFDGHARANQHKYIVEISSIFADMFTIMATPTWTPTNSNFFHHLFPKKQKFGSNNSKLMEKMEALTTKTDSQFKDITEEIKEIRDGCSKCGGLHLSSECDDKTMGEPEEEANYIKEENIDETTT
ncbi:hypothetical protein Tco_1128854, partial [Tanacetum coccineum]